MKNAEEEYREDMRAHLDKKFSRETREAAGMNSSADHELYTANVDIGVWPGEKLVPLPQPFINDSGVIQNLILRPVTSVAIITSKADTIRANHYHRTDWHYTYIVSGKIIYFERKVGSTEVPTPNIFLAGQMFFTPPMTEHVMYFPIETTFITMAKNVRSHESHEADLVRVNFITKDMVPSDLKIGHTNVPDHY